MSTTNGAEVWRTSVSVGRSILTAALAQLESGHMDYMCQVSSSELDLIDPCLDLCVDFVECALERGIDGAEVWKRGGEAWAQEAVETGLTRARHEPAIGATKSTRLVGLRRSLASTDYVRFVSAYCPCFETLASLTTSASRCNFNCG